MGNLLARKYNEYVIVLLLRMIILIWLGALGVGNVQSKRKRPDR